MATGTPVTEREAAALQRDLLTETYAELAIRLGILALFLYWSLLFVRPFISIIIWSVVLTVALYPIYDWIASLVGGRRRIAAALTTILALLVVLGPATWLVVGLIDSIRLLLERFDIAALTLPPPSESVRRWPVVGDRLFQFWELAATNIQAAIAKVMPHLRPLGTTVMHIAADAGAGTLKFLAAVIIAGFLFVPGPSLVQAVKSFARRVASQNGEVFVVLAGSTIRTVAQGVLGISALQALLAGIGLIAAGIPAASLLTAAILIFGIIQIGPTLVILPLIVWSWMSMETSAALLFTIYMICVNVLDNVLKPIVMRRGLTTPIAVIFIGLIGGTLSYGITGLFLGPIVLAVIWELTAEWIGVQASKEPKATLGTVAREGSFEPSRATND
jgi:predicted PurR-regulated permease PerM